MKTLGQIAYEAWKGESTFHTWGQQLPDARERWEAAGTAVRREVEMRLSPDESSAAPLPVADVPETLASMRSAEDWEEDVTIVCEAPEFEE